MVYRGGSGVLVSFSDALILVSEICGFQPGATQILRPDYNLISRNDSN